MNEMETAVNQNESYSSVRHVLVCFGERKRVLTFTSCRGKRDAAGLLEAVLEGFIDIISRSDLGKICLQIRDESWGGEFVDLIAQEVPEKSVVRVLLEKTVLDPQDGQSAVEGTTASNVPVLVTVPQSERQLHFVSGTSGRLELERENTDDTRMGLLSEEEIKDKAVIYRKENKRPLSEFQKKMNAAAVQIALRDPSVLAACNMLLNAAREKVINDGYQFKKGKSRSKKVTSSEAEAEATPKRPKMDQAVRQQRIKELNEDIKDCQDSIRFKEKRRRAAENEKRYKTCEDITDEISVLVSII